MIRNEREFNNGGKRENVVAVGCYKGKARESQRELFKFLKLLIFVIFSLHNHFSNIKLSIKKGQ